MINISEYLVTKSKTRYNKNVIIAHDNDIKRIIKQEIERLGPKANLNHIDVSEVTNMSELFMCLDSDYPLYRYRYELNPDISEWNTCRVKYMINMFRDCTAFNCDISKWDVSNVENMELVFAECDNFNQPLNDWNVSNVESMRCMFFHARHFNQDISNWDVSNVKNMGSMFDGAYDFDQDLSKWDVSKVSKDSLTIFFNTKMEQKHKYSQYPKFNWDKK